MCPVFPSTKLLRAEFAAYLQGLQQRKPVVLTGDLNVAPADIDIHNPKGNLKSAGEGGRAAGGVAAWRGYTAGGFRCGQQALRQPKVASLRVPAPAPEGQMHRPGATCLHFLPSRLPPLPPIPGFTPEERASFADNLLAGCGLVDAFRAQYPEAVGYTYWSYRYARTSGHLVGCGGHRLLLLHFGAMCALRAAPIHHGSSMTSLPAAGSTRAPTTAAGGWTTSWCHRRCTSACTSATCCPA